MPLSLVLDGGIKKHPMNPSKISTEIKRANPKRKCLFHKRIPAGIVIANDGIGLFKHRLHAALVSIENVIASNFSNVSVVNQDFGFKRECCDIRQKKSKRVIRLFESQIAV